MSLRYPIPAKTVRIETTVKRSRFVATITHVETVEAARVFIQDIRNEMPDATHHVYAFRVVYGSSVIEGLSDDGEPAGTSGKPVMSVIRGSDLGDVVIVVTRYFGGTKLGTGGLVRAYSGAAKEALNLLPVTEKISYVTLKATVSYQAYEPFTRFLAEHHANIVDEMFTHDVTVIFMAPAEHRKLISENSCEYTVGKVPPITVK
jgi:uncharacterized YigZ family protein